MVSGNHTDILSSWRVWEGIGFVDGWQWSTQSCITLLIRNGVGSIVLTLATFPQLHYRFLVKLLFLFLLQPKLLEFYIFRCIRLSDGPASIHIVVFVKIFVLHIVGVRITIFRARGLEYWAADVAGTGDFTLWLFSIDSHIHLLRFSRHILQIK